MGILYILVYAFPYLLIFLEIFLVYLFLKSKINGFALIIIISLIIIVALILIFNEIKNYGYYSMHIEKFVYFLSVIIIPLLSYGLVHYFLKTDKSNYIFIAFLIPIIISLATSYLYSTTLLSGIGHQNGFSGSRYKLIVIEYKENDHLIIFNQNVNLPNQVKVTIVDD